MSKVDDFKQFVKKNPNLVTYVRNDTMTWQKFYELYDIYGEETDVWHEYLKKEEKKEIKSENTNINKFTLGNIMEIAKNIDTNKLQEGISSIQKAIGLLGDMMIKDKPETNNYTPRPIYRKFDD